MKALQIQWSDAKQKDLESQLVGYWAQDEWRLGDCPIQDGCKNCSADKVVRFSCQSPSLKAEMKYALWQKIEKHQWQTQTLWLRAHNIQEISNWIDKGALRSTSLLERDEVALSTSLRSYLISIGKWRVTFRRRLDKELKEHKWERTGYQLYILQQILKVLRKFYDVRDEYDKEVWDLRILGYQGNPSQSSYTVNFSKLSQPWLLHATKAIIKYSLPIFSYTECQTRLGALNHFSQFLQQFHPNIAPSEIDRSVVLDYRSCLAGMGVGESARHKYLRAIRTFLELCSREGWADIPDRRFVYREDFPQRSKSQPRFIPEEVMVQLNENLNGLPQPYRRMALILQEVGMRITELCRMPFDCLLQDAQGDFILRYYQYKMKKEHSVPISREIAAVIQEQQKSVRARYGNYPYLFPAKNRWQRGEASKHRTFSDALNRLAFQKNICDNAGTLWRFQSHQFRHTVGTRMVNLGVPQHIIQRYLGHETPEMTSTYAHIHDQTLKEEFAKFKSKIVDVTGKTILPKDISVEGPEFQWFKKNVLAQALPNGSCALPVVAGECPHANACLTCVHFRTDTRFLDEHQKQYEHTQHFLEVARANGWTRQVEMNERVKTNLEAIIKSLGEDADES